jgi:hypothetical protein
MEEERVRGLDVVMGDKMKTNLHLLSQSEERGWNTMGRRGAEHNDGLTVVGDRDGEQV